MSTIHPTAQVHESVKLGNGTTVWACANVMAEVITGKNCSIGFGVEVGRGTVMGDNVRIGYGTFIPSRTNIGNRVFIGPNVTMTDDKFPRVDNPDYHAQPPTLEDEAVVGAGSILLPGVRVGWGALVGAGSVVTKDVLPGTTVYGNPARTRSEHGHE